MRKIATRASTAVVLMVVTGVVRAIGTAARHGAKESGCGQSEFFRSWGLGSLS